MTSKKFFQERTKAEIKKLNLIHADSDLVDRIENLDENEALVIERRLIPESFTNARKFLKHGSEVKPRRIYSLDDLARGKIVPVKLREDAFNNIQNKAYSGYSFMPFAGKDRRKRKISLVECLEGARIYAYAHRFGTGIEVKGYDECKKTEKEGAVITVRVPSRTKKKSKYDFNLVSVPVEDSIDKFAIAHSIASEGHDCKRKQYGFRFTYEDIKEDSRLFNFCAHEIAADLQVIEDYWRKNKNIIPLEMSQFAIPTQFEVDYYKKIRNNVLIRDETIQSKDKLRKPGKSDTEILVWGNVYKHGHDKTFFAREKLENYYWE